ncbi:hypothetical protein [uncultured Alsobacter sp.]|uniref:hypothetical protein n=1 Tax=uncultured Alsobacter sp. TaxID=1748258 RepID=UPI0025EAB007|nr:hypothetical protein [uncultured Alsobacter sp.]
MAKPKIGADVTPQEKQIADDLGKHVGERIVVHALDAMKLTDRTEQDLIIAMHVIGAAIGVLSGVLRQISEERTGERLSPAEAIACAREFAFTTPPRR